MPTFERALDLYLNTRLNERVRVFAGSTSPAELASLQIVEGDHFTLRVHPRRRGSANTASTEEVTLPAGTTIVAALKNIDDLDGQILALADGFAEQTDGQATWWEAPLNLNTTELVNAMAGLDRLQCRLDVEIRDSANTRRATIPVPAIVLPEAYQAGDADPTAADPGYPAAGDIALRAPGQNYRIKSDGTLQLYDTTDAAWRSIWLDGGALQIGPAEA